MMAAPEPILGLDDVSVTYNSGKRTAFHAVDRASLELGEGEILGLVGESGCGKSSLAKAIVRLLRPSNGHIFFRGTDIADMPARRLKPIRRHIQMVFQDPFSSLDPRMRVRSTLSEPLEVHGLHHGRHRERVAELLDLVGLPREAADRYPHEFSGGQRQRIGIARALAAEPSVLVCDEPTSALDVSIQSQILNLLGELQRELGLSILFISHNLPAVAMFAQRVAVMERGRAVEVLPSAGFETHARHPYTRALLSAVPLADPLEDRKRRRIPLPGLEGRAPETGCAFQPRCWLYRDQGEPSRCRAERPDLRVAGPGHYVRCHFCDEVEPAQLQTG